MVNLNQIITDVKQSPKTTSMMYMEWYQNWCHVKYFDVAEANAIYFKYPLNDERMQVDKIYRSLSHLCTERVILKNNLCGSTACLRSTPTD